MIHQFIIIVIIIFKFSNLNAHEISYADSHGPISIMGDHTHKKNDFMFSYRFMYMQMNNIKQGTKKVSVGNTMRAPSKATVSGTYECTRRCQWICICLGNVCTSGAFNCNTMTSYNERNDQQKNADGWRGKI